MRYQVLNVFVCCLVFITATSASEVTRKSLSTKFGNDLWDNESHLLIVEIKSTKVDREPVDGLVRVHFKATVINDCRGKLQGRDIQIVGSTVRLLSGPRKDWINAYEAGQLIIVLVRPQDGTYQVTGHGSLPIGIGYPTAVPREEIAALGRALELMYRLSELSIEEAVDAKHQKLVKSSDYYEWALNASIQAIGGTSEDRSRLVDIVWQKDVTLEKILWMEYLIDSVFPPAERPSVAKRHHNLLSYLKRRGGTAIQIEP